MLKILETIRQKRTAQLDQEKKSELGQFMTPSSVARFMASMFDPSSHSKTHVLDAGAGTGSLLTAFLQKYKEWNHEALAVTAYEIDDHLRFELEELFDSYAVTTDATFEIHNVDFIEEAAHQILFVRERPFTHALLNPPYKKISSDSRHRSLLRSVGIETVNLYAAFVALSIKLLVEGGQLVAIIPRSFCNGPYYKSFRNLIYRQTAIRRIHLFGARDKAFKEDNVLQENVIIFLERDGKQSDVVISTSTDDTFSDLETRNYSFERILYPGDPEGFLHIPTSEEPDFHEASAVFKYSLSELFIEVSTGPVVDFRVRDHTLDMPEGDSAPLIYPGHFDGNNFNWPRINWKRPNAISLYRETDKWMFPSGFYTVVRRFSSKEEKRRITASVFDPSQLPNFDLIGFENHLNVFHFRKKGLDEYVARGLAVFLNSTAVDNYFRRLNGHTQVNATDLRRLSYPNIATLCSLGRLAKQVDSTAQGSIDKILDTVSA